MGQAFFEQSHLLPDRPKSEVELTMEEADALLKEIRAYTAKLLERERETEKRIESLGGEAVLRAELEELKHDNPWWREFEEDLAGRNFESVVVRQI